jgi:hypothetical protein
VKLLWNVLATAVTTAVTWLVVHNLIAYTNGRPWRVPSDLWIVFVAAFFGRTIGAAFWGDKAK